MPLFGKLPTKQIRNCLNILQIDRYRRYKIRDRFENRYIKYMGAKGNTDQILLIFRTRSSYYQEKMSN